MSYHQAYTEKEFIGRGNYGKVYLVYDNKSLKLFVAKKISLEGLKFEEVDRTMREIEIHKQLSHSNIIGFREYFLEEDVLIILMEYCEYGDLSVYIQGRQQKQEYFEQPLIMNLFIQMTLGVQYLHQHKIVHRDIKPHNIFINEEGVLKLADFGIAKAMDHTTEKAMTLVGTPYYLSPEACKNEGYTAKSDVWALGCVLYELTALKHAFEGSNVLSLANKITHDPVHPIPPQYSKDLFELIQLLLQKDSAKRPSVREILELPYVKQHNSNFSQAELEPYMEKQFEGSLDCEAQASPQKRKRSEQYQNEFLPNFDKEYKNEFLEDETFHPKPTSKGNPSSKTSSPVQVKKPGSRANLQQQISPRKSAAMKLKDKCRKKLGEALFDEMYGLMRKWKGEGLSQIEVQGKLREKYGRGEFDQAMDVAQLIYIQDNP